MRGSGPGAGPVLLAVILAEEFGDPPVGDVLPTVEALGVPAQEHFNAVARALRNLGGVHASVEPGRQSGVPQVVRAGSKRRGHLFRRQRQVPRLVPYAPVRGGGDHSPALIGEQPAVLGGTELLDVREQDADEAGRNRNDAGLVRGPVLEPAVVVHLPRSGPTLADGGTALLQDQRAPPGVRQRAVRTTQRHRFRWPKPTEVHVGEQRDQAAPTSPAVATDVRDSAKEFSSLAGFTTTRRSTSLVTFGSFHFTSVTGFSGSSPMRSGHEVGDTSCGGAVRSTAATYWPQHLARGSKMFVMARTRKIAGAALIGLLILVGVCGYGWLLWRGPWYFDRPHLRQRDLQPADGVVITGFRTTIVALGAGVVAATGLWYTSRNHRLARDQFGQTQEQFKLAQQQFEHTQEQFQHTQAKDHEQATIAREGQVTDRYVAAIKLLGSANVSERLGGIYSLERIMGDSDRDAKTVIEVLAAFIRSPHSIIPEGSETNPQSKGTAEDLQAAVTVLARRPDSAKKTHINLAGAKLSRVQIEGADLAMWDMRSADLSHSNLQQAHLAGAHLEEANLEGASMYRANLEGAYLNKARLTSANLWGANMRETTLFGTDLSKCLNMDREQLVEAHITFTTTLPREFDVDDEIERRMQEGERVTDGRDPYNV